MAADVQREARRLELQELLRLNEEIVAAKQDSAELLLNLARRKRVLDSRRRPLRVLADLAHLSPQQLELLLTSDRRADYSTAEKLATLGTYTVAQWWSSLGYETAPGLQEEERAISPADQAVLDLISHWPEERKYALAAALEPIMGEGREDSSRE